MKCNWLQSLVAAILFQLIMVVLLILQHKTLFLVSDSFISLCVYVVKLFFLEPAASCVSFTLITTVKTPLKPLQLVLSLAA